MRKATIRRSRSRCRASKAPHCSLSPLAAARSKRSVWLEFSLIDNSPRESTVQPASRRTEERRLPRIFPGLRQSCKRRAFLLAAEPFSVRSAFCAPLRETLAAIVARRGAQNAEAFLLFSVFAVPKGMGRAVKYPCGNRVRAAGLHAWADVFSWLRRPTRDGRIVPCGVGARLSGPWECSWCWLGPARLNFLILAT